LYHYCDIKLKGEEEEESEKGEQSQLDNMKEAFCTSGHRSRSVHPGNLVFLRIKCLPRETAEI
jgi:hypothetical protein